MSAQLFVSILVILIALQSILGATSYLILLERKISAWVQDRTGPNRTGFAFGLDTLWNFLRIPFMNRFHFWGLGQPLADGLKLFLKEDYTRPGVERTLFLLAPVIVVIPAILGWAVIPWGGYVDFPGIAWLGIEPGVVEVVAAPLNVGAIYILAIGSLAVYAVVLAGFASNNKYSFLGGLRATAQMLSYEIPQGLAVLIMILMTGTAATSYFVNLQVMDGWFIFSQPLLAIIFFTCVLAECNRAPFDLAEAEQELVGGFHTEYSSMKWALFFLGEYIHMITGSAFFALLFLGGWSLNPFGFGPNLPIEPGGLLPMIAKINVFVLKVAILLAVMMWIRWTLPRLRFDQLMRLAWRALIPLTLVILLLTSVLIFAGITHWWAYLAANGVAAVVGILGGKLIPADTNVNRKVALKGSRFSPLAS